MFPYNFNFTNARNCRLLLLLKI